MAKAAKKSLKKVPKLAKEKAPKKEAKKLKPSKPEKKPKVDVKLKDVKSKTAGASKSASATHKTKPEAGSAAKKKVAKAAGKLPDKGKKKTKRDEDELLPEPTDSGEDLPDLNEFNEEEVLQEEEIDEEDVEIEDVDAEALLAGDDDEVILTDAEGRRYCKVKDCDQVSTVEGYCRYHYLLLWKKIQVRRKILADGKLERYVEELTSRYPDKFLEMIRRDLKTEKDFQAAIAELEIDESNLDGEYEDEAQSFIDEVRGVSETGISEEEEF